MPINVCILLHHGHLWNRPQAVLSSLLPKVKHRKRNAGSDSRLLVQTGCPRPLIKFTSRWKVPRTRPAQLINSYSSMNKVRVHCLTNREGIELMIVKCDVWCDMIRSGKTAVLLLTLMKINATHAHSSWKRRHALHSHHRGLHILINPTVAESLSNIAGE
jgi:hypothetical protein